jgi:RHS repeat-associated protein
MIKPGEVAYYFHNDHLGTPQILTDDTQTIAWKAVFTPFGAAVGSIETVENPFRLPGQYYDGETGFHYNYFRYYDPTAGRFITPDPIGLKGGINLFTYSASNPINWVDTDGLDVYFVGAGAAAYIGNIGPIAKKDQRGYGTQAGYGIAYDTETKKIILFATGGTANQTEDKVTGISAGLGLFGGQLKGGLQDFLGESRERSTTAIIRTITSIETATGKEGIAFSIGGKGFGLSYTSITTETFNLIDRIKEIFGLEKRLPKTRCK